MASIFYQNCRGLRTDSKRLTFYSNLIGCDYDLVVLTETWLNENFNSCNYFTDEYFVYRKDRSGLVGSDSRVSGGGTLIAIKKSFKVHRRFDLDFNNIEVVWIEVKLDSGVSLLIGNHYFPPTIQIDLLQNYVNFLEESIEY